MISNGLKEVVQAGFVITGLGVGGGITTNRVATVGLDWIAVTELIIVIVTAAFTAVMEWKRKKAAEKKNGK